MMKILATNNKQSLSLNGARLTKSILLSVLGLVISQQSFSQYVLEPFVSDDNMILESWYYNTITESKRLSLFNLNEVNYNYDTESSSLLSYGVLGYDLAKGFGPIVGWRLSALSSATLAGVQYGLYRENFFAFFYLNSELKNNPNFEFYTITQYRPQITDRFKGFGQLQISKNFNEDMHTYSLYRLRLGADLGKIQTGVGVDQTFAGGDWESNIAPGVFLRLELY